MQRLRFNLCGTLSVSISEELRSDCHRPSYHPVVFGDDNPGRNLSDKNMLMLKVLTGEHHQARWEREAGMGNPEAPFIGVEWEALIKAYKDEYGEGNGTRAGFIAYLKQLEKSLKIKYVPGEHRFTSERFAQGYALEAQPMVQDVNLLLSSARLKSLVYPLVNQMRAFEGVFPHGELLKYQSGQSRASSQRMLHGIYLAKQLPRLLAVEARMEIRGIEGILQLLPEVQQVARLSVTGQLRARDLEQPVYLLHDWVMNLAYSGHSRHLLLFAPLAMKRRELDKVREGLVGAVQQLRQAFERARQEAGSDKLFPAPRLNDEVLAAVGQALPEASDRVAAQEDLRRALETVTTRRT